MGVFVDLQPYSPEESAWMQGLLLALSHGALGRLGPGGSLPQLQGPLERCVRLEFEWRNLEDRLQLWRERCRYKAALKEAEGDEAIDQAIIRRLRLDQFKSPEPVQNPWPPTGGESYLPRTLLRRARRRPGDSAFFPPDPHRRTFRRLDPS